MSNLQRNLALVAVGALLASTSAAFAMLGPPGGTIYAHDEAYATIPTPANLPEQGNFDQIYVLGGDLASVADAAPGDPSYNGGRWEVHPVDFLTIPPTQFTNAEDILDAANRGEVFIGMVVRRFECPLIPTHGSGQSVKGSGQVAPDDPVQPSTWGEIKSLYTQ